MLPCLGRLAKTARQHAEQVETAELETSFLLRAAIVSRSPFVTRGGWARVRCRLAVRCALRWSETMAENSRCVIAVLALCAWGCTETGPEPATSQRPADSGGPPAAAGPAGSTSPGAVGGASGAAASGNPDQPSAAGSTAGAGPVPTAGSGGAADTAGAPADLPASAQYDHENEAVNLDADLVVAAGATLRVGPGTTFTARTGVKVQVLGTLVAAGTAGAPVKFLGAGMPRSWHGIVVESGGTLELTHVAIGGATYGIHALPGSDFTVDHADIGTSFKAAVVQSDGSFDHTRFHASGDPTFSPVNEVSVEDVNGTLTILDASPTVSNSRFDGSAALVDMIRVGGASSAVFDHLYIADAHCGIHANGGVNSTPVVTNTIFERLAYGLMVYATKPSISDSVFIDNGNDVGFCFDATEANAPTLANNFYSSGAALIDPTCFQIGTVATNSAASANPEAGPMGL